MASPGVGTHLTSRPASPSKGPSSSGVPGPSGGVSRRPAVAYGATTSAPPSGRPSKPCSGEVWQMKQSSSRGSGSANIWVRKSRGQLR